MLVNRAMSSMDTPWSDNAVCPSFKGDQRTSLVGNAEKAVTKTNKQKTIWIHDQVIDMNQQLETRPDTHSNSYD
jgi:hypothetical protein